jgi:hypothetical protein
MGKGAFCDGLRRHKLTKTHRGDIALQRRREGIQRACEADIAAHHARKALDVAARATGWELKEERHLTLKTTEIRGAEQ